MRDTDPPNCPTCGSPMRRCTSFIKLGSSPREWYGISAVVYHCKSENVFWWDYLDGTPLSMQARKRSQPHG